MESYLPRLKSLFIRWCGAEAETVAALPQSGSQRRYYRLRGGGFSAIGAWNPEPEENRAFIHFTEVFRTHGLTVPQILESDLVSDIYLVEDLGDISLLDLAGKRPRGSNLPGEVIALYRKALDALVGFQVVAGKDIDANLCYPRSAFDRRAILWDLNYFKYYFLKLHTTFHEDRLEDDFEALACRLLEAGGGHFMYRDFQARNILVRNDTVHFIDYQGGRMGPLQYDVASLLFQVKAGLSPADREQLLGHYLLTLSSRIKLDEAQFRRDYDLFVLVRLLQVLGAYGYRGLIQRKAHFLQSIAPALDNLRVWLEHIPAGADLPELFPVLRRLVETAAARYPITVPEPAGLTVRISSFSYKESVPVDQSGNGGGFVFDCRALPNPGREEQYRAFNGKDAVIRDYLGPLPEVQAFLEQAFALVSASVENYSERGFHHLQVSFGCTGGQHRSVYCAETLAGMLNRKFPFVRLEVYHPMISSQQQDMHHG